METVTGLLLSRRLMTPQPNRWASFTVWRFRCRVHHRMVFTRPAHTIQPILWLFLRLPLPLLTSPNSSLPGRSRHTWATPDPPAQRDTRAQREPQAAREPPDRRDSLAPPVPPDL